MRGWGWAPWWLPVAVGLILGAAGSPRCPVLVSAAVRAVIFRDGRWWGPPAFLNLAVATWQRMERWLAGRLAGLRPAVDALAAGLSADLRAGRP
eukprot:2187825-Alexandrium_andersonii.AAC.1